MRKKILFLTLFMSLCLSGSGAAAMLQYRGSGVVVRYSPALGAAALRLVSAYPGIKSDLQTKLGWKVNFVPVVVLMLRHSEFRKLSQNTLVTAFAVPGQDLIVMDYSKTETTPFDFNSTLEHELCHLLLHRHIQAPPKWLDEGVAQWVSGGMADIMNPGEKNILRETSLSNRLIPFEALSVSFPDNPRGFLLAYEESKSFLEYIVHEYGAGKLRDVLHLMQEGSTADEAITVSLGQSLDSLQDAWIKSLRRKYSWPSYLADNLFWILFFAAALATFMAYLQVRRRIKNYRDEDDQDIADEEYPGDKME